MLYLFFNFNFFKILYLSYQLPTAINIHNFIYVLSNVIEIMELIYDVIRFHIISFIIFS